MLYNNRDRLYALLLFVALTSALFGPVLWHFNDWLYGIGGDGFGGPLGIAQRRAAIDQGNLLTPLPSLLGAPFNHSPDGLFTIEPLWWYSGVALSYVLSPVGATNALVFLSFLMTGMASYAFLRRGLIPSAALVGALIYTYCPIRMAEAQEHFNYLSGYLLFVECWLLFSLTQAHRWRYYVALGLCLAVTELTSVYLAYFGLLLAFAWIGLILVIRTARRQWRDAGSLVAGLCLFCTVFGMIVLTTQWPIVNRIQSGTDPALRYLIRPMTDLEDLSLKWWHFLLPPPDNPLVHTIVEMYGLNYGRAEQSIDQSTTIGISALVLALIGAAVTFSRRGRRLHADPRADQHWLPPDLSRENCHLVIACMGATCVTVGIVFGLPPWIDLLGHHILTPSFVVYSVLPEVRTLSRIDLLIEVGISFLAALGTALVLDQVRGRKRCTIVVAGITALVLVEASNVPPWHWQRVLPAPQVDRWLATTPESRSGVVAQYPLEADTYARTTLYAFYAYAVHHHRILNGVMSGTPQDALRGNLSDIFNPTTPASLAALGVHTATLDTRSLRLAFANAGLTLSNPGGGSMADLPSGFTTTYSDSESVAYTVTSKPADEIAGFGAGFRAPEWRGDRRAWSWIDDRGALWLYNVTSHPLESVLWTEVHNNREPHSLSWPGYVPALIPNASDASAVAIAAQIAPGIHSLPVQALGESVPLSRQGRPLRVQLRTLEPAPVHRVGASFIEAGRERWRLDGVSTDACTLQAGAELDVALLWSVMEPTDEPLTVFLHLVNGESIPLAQGDGPPNRGASPTDQLPTGANLADVHTIRVPDALAPGRYVLRTGLYNVPTGARLMTTGDRDSVDIGSVVVTPNGSGPKRIGCTW